MYCQNLLELALLLAEHDPTYEDLATKFFEHFALIASALNEKGLWDEEDGFYYDVLHDRHGSVVPLRARSIVGLLPLAAVTTLGPETMARLPDFMARLDVVHGQPARGARASSQHMDVAPTTPAGGCSRSSARSACAGCSRAMLDPDEFLSDARPARAVALPRGQSAPVSSRRRLGDARLRAGRVDERPLRRQLELARPGLVPGQLPARRGAARLPPLPRRRVPRSSSRPGSGRELTLGAGRRRARRRGSSRSSSSDDGRHAARVRRLRAASRTTRPGTT